MAFVDLEKAFDNINWKILFNIMDNVGIDIKDRNILYAIGIRYTKIKKLKLKLIPPQRQQIHRS